MAAQSSLASKSCTPCRGGVPPLTAEEVSAHQRQTPEWSVADEARRIERTFKFRNFADAFVFVGQVADLAEAEGHHPDIRFGWGYVTVSLQTKKIKGVEKIGPVERPSHFRRRGSDEAITLPRNLMTNMAKGSYVLGLEGRRV